MSDPYKKSYILKRILKKGSFEDNYPERALDWDYDDERNKPYKPSDFLSGSNKRVYWKCHVCGYKSKTPKTIISHARATFPCEKCAIKGRTNQRYGEEPITVTNPELLQEWDYVKNVQDGIFPEKITNHDSRTLVHWVCKRGHHWKRSVSYRLHSTSGKCPICQGEMQTSFPEQTLFFYFNKQVECINGYKLKNNSHIDIFIPSRKIGIEYDGPKHISPKQKARDERKNILLRELGIKLYRVVQSDMFRVENNTIYVIYDNNYTYMNYVITNLCKLMGIQYIPFSPEKHKVEIVESYLTREKENSIATLYPNILAEWDYKKNGCIDPQCISYGSGLKIYWKCTNGHSWSASPSNRIKGHGCPYCAGVKLLSGYNDLATLHPELLEEWDYRENKNSSIIPEGITAGNSKRKVFWICKKNPEHKWASTVASRVSGTGCPFCAEEQRKITKRQTYIKRNGSFAENNPQLLKDWNYDKNDTLRVFPNNIPNRYSKRVWWKCHICDYVWLATPDSRVGGHGCPKCSERNHSQRVRNAIIKKSGSLLQNFPNIAAFWNYKNNIDKDPDSLTAKCHDKINWKCPKCGHKWSKRVYKMTQYPCCPKCKYSLNEEKKPIIQFDLELNEIARYNSPKEASCATKIARQYILATARHDSRSTHGFVFRYEDDISDLNLFKPSHQPTPKVVLQYTKEGDFVQEWNCISDAEKKYSIAHGKISAVCKGKRKSAGGYIWKYKDIK